jgi:hypothetical protein
MRFLHDVTTHFLGEANTLEAGADVGWAADADVMRLASTVPFHPTGFNDAVPPVAVTYPIGGPPNVAPGVARGEYFYYNYNVLPAVDAYIVADLEGAIQGVAALLDDRFDNRLYHHVKDLATFYPKLLSLDVFDDNKTIARKAAFSNAVWKENLLTVGGLSHYLPTKVFKPYLQYPGLIQDMDLDIGSSKPVKYRDFSRDVTNCVVELTPQDEYTIQTYTQNVFRQEDKSLQTMDWDVPLIERYQQTFVKSPTGVYSIPFETSKARPSKLFIYIERVGVDVKSVYSNNNPSVINLELQCLGQSIQSIRDLDVNQTYEATRRNAALRCDLLKLRQETGGILFGLEDVCNWNDFDVFGARDSFKGTFVVKEGGVESIDSTAITTVSAAEEVLLFEQDRRITVLFIYENHCLKGEGGTLRFWLRDYKG